MCHLTNKRNNKRNFRWIIQYTAIGSHCNTHASHRNTLQHTVTHCNTLQHAALHCTALYHTVSHCNTLQHSALHCTALHCTVMQHTATHCTTLRHTHHYLPASRLQNWSPPPRGSQMLGCKVTEINVAHCNTLQHTATHLHHTATHCNTLIVTCPHRVGRIGAPPPPAGAKCLAARSLKVPMWRQSAERLSNENQPSPLSSCNWKLQCVFKRVAVCCSVLQMCCNVLRCVAVCCSVLQWEDDRECCKKTSSRCCRTETNCCRCVAGVLQVCCRCFAGVLQVCCSVLQCFAVWCSERPKASVIFAVYCRSFSYIFKFCIKFPIHRTYSDVRQNMI